MEVIWGHILKSPRVILNLITPHCILLYFLDIFSLIFASLLAWNIILLSVFSSFSLFLFLSLIAFDSTPIAIQYRLGAISYRWDKNIFRTLIVQCLFWMSYFRT